MTKFSKWWGYMKVSGTQYIALATTGIRFMFSTLTNLFLPHARPYARHASCLHSLKAYGVVSDRYTFCQKCFNDIQGDTVTLGDDPLQPQTWVLPSLMLTVQCYCTVLHQNESTVVIIRISYISEIKMEPFEIIHMS